MELTSVKTVFFKFLLMPILMALIVVVLGAIRNATPAIKIKTIIVYFILCTFSIAIGGFLGFSGNQFSPYWYLFAMLFYLGLGILNVNLLHYYFRKHFQITWKAMLFEIILSIASLIGGAYFFSLIFQWISQDLGNPYMAATSGTIFLVPLFFYYSYIQFISIPFDIYKTWQYHPEQKPYDFKGADFDKLMVLNVELSKSPEDLQRFNIKAKTLPTEITFGDWFHRVIDDYNFKNPNTPIMLTNKAGTPYFWIFYVKKSFFSTRKYIDFERDITHNKLVENETVICKRVLNHQEEGRLIKQ